MPTSCMISPQVSVIIPCFNQGIYLEEAIDSVLRSTYENYEIIVVNDGSTDPFTIQLLEALNKPHTSILNSQNKGAASARNLGIENAKGEYILPLDADDKISSEYISKAVKILDSKPNVGIVYSKAKMFGEKRGKWRLPTYSFEHMLASNIIFCSSFFRKKDWRKVNGYKPEIPNGKEDWEFWLSLLEVGLEVYQIPEVLFYYRIKQVSRDTIANEKDKAKLINERIYELHKELYNKHLPNPLQLYQENFSYLHLFKRIDYRLGRILFSPFFFLKKLFKIP